MAFQFYCPQGHLLQSDPAHLGQQCQCPHCGTLFVIPTVVEDSAAAGRISGLIEFSRYQPCMVPDGRKFTDLFDERPLFHSPRRRGAMVDKPSCRRCLRRPAGFAFGHRFMVAQSSRLAAVGNANRRPIISPHEYQPFGPTGGGAHKLLVERRLSLTRPR